MAYSDEDIALQLQLGEDSQWEFKQIDFSGTRPRSPGRNDLADEIAAFANAEGGVLLCGITDKGDVQNLSSWRSTRSWSRSVPTPSSQPFVFVPGTRRPRMAGVSWSSRSPRATRSMTSYVRVGGSKREMTSDERLRLAQRRGQARFVSFDEQTVPQTGFHTLDESLWKPLLSAEGAVEPESALGKLALLLPDETGTPRATVAGVLLCTRNPERWLPNACITATRYRGKDRASGQLDAQEISGPLNRQIADAVAFAVRNMQVAARKEPARVNLPQYSDKALFEALVNAVVHRDYSIRASKIRLSMFEDRLEIQSPGALPNNLTLESMAARQATRNEALTSILGRMPVGDTHGSRDRQFFMERRGDGVPIIQRETRELCGRLPEYRLIDDTEVLLVIPAAILEPSPARATITVYGAGKPLADVDILALFPNKTWKRGLTDEHGEAQLNLHTTHLPMTVFAAARGFSACMEHTWRPAERGLALDLEELPVGGAVIFPEATGHLPGRQTESNPG